MPQEKKTENKSAAAAKKTNASSKAADDKKNDAFIEYKGKPLVRSGDTVYYGNVNDAYIVCLNIKSSKDFKDIKLADDVSIQLLSTDESLPLKDRVIKKSEKKGLFNALDLGAAWLQRQLKKEAQAK